MGPRLGLALSFLAACGIHGAILLVPRAPFADTRQLPTVEIDLSAPSSETAPAVARAAGLRAPAARPGRPQSAQLSAASAAPIPEPAPAGAPGPASAAAPAAEPPVPLPDKVEPPTQTQAVLPPAPGPPDGSAANGELAFSRANGKTSPGLGGGAEQAASDIRGDGAPGPGSAPGPSVSAMAGLLPPRPVTAIRPVYPRAARSSGAQGLVRIAVTVEASGTVSAAEVLTSSGNAALDAAALDAARRAAFSPAKRDGVPVASRVIVPIRFQLSQSP